MDLVSILILNYNGLEYLQQTLPNIRKLTFPNKEIVIFDNASEDKSCEYIMQFLEIKLIKSNKNLGYSKGKNEGVKECNGKYILMLDNDILILDDNILKKLINNYEKNIAFLQVPLVNLNETKTIFYGIFYSIYGVNLHKKPIEIEKIINSENEIIEIAGATGGCMFFLKTIWEEIGGFDESQKFNIDDIDIGARSIILGYKNYLYTKSYFLHIGIAHKNSKKLYAKRFKLIFSGHARSFLKNYKLTNVILLFPIFFIFQFFKAIKYSIYQKNIQVFFSFIYSFIIFIYNLPDTLRERRIIQGKRKIKKDIFLSIKPIKF
jgi:GT2 family glycosyltransferase